MIITIVKFMSFCGFSANFVFINLPYIPYNYTWGLDHKYRVLDSVCLSVCLCVSMITQKINDLGS